MMNTPLTKHNTEINPLIIEIVKLAAEGLSDPQIAAKLGKHSNTILSYRKQYGIQSGYLRRTELAKASKRKSRLKFQPLSQLRV